MFKRVSQGRPVLELVGPTAGTVLVHFRSPDKTVLQKPTVGHFIYQYKHSGDLIAEYSCASSHGEKKKPIMKTSLSMLLIIVVKYLKGTLGAT